LLAKAGGRSKAKHGKAAHQGPQGIL